MNTTPILSSGKLVRDGDSWMIRLESDSPLLNEGMNVKLVVWSSGDGSEGEVEGIAITYRYREVAFVFSCNG